MTFCIYFAVMDCAIETLAGASHEQDARSGDAQYCQSIWQVLCAEGVDLTVYPGEIHALMGKTAPVKAR
jgi:hypothetical protein